MMQFSLLNVYMVVTAINLCPIVQLIEEMRNRLIKNMCCIMELRGFLLEDKGKRRFGFVSIWYCW